MADNAFTSGFVTTFAGNTGLRKALLDWCVGTKSSAVVLSGSGTAYSGTLTLTGPLSPGSMLVNYTIGGTTYQAQDDGSGGISGTGISAGTINYSSGAYSITFSSTAAGVTADYVEGEPGQDWEILVERDTRDDSDVNPFTAGELEEVILRNRGVSGQENVMIGFREWEYLAGNAAGWDLNVYTYFNAGMAWNANKTAHGRQGYSSTWNRWYTLPQLPLVDDTIYYWFFSNRQRIIVIAKVQSNYESCYLGFGLRYSAPARYPYPLVNKGSSWDEKNFSWVSNQRRGLARNDWSSNGYPLLVVTPGTEFTGSIGTSTYSQGPKLLPMSAWSSVGIIAPAPTTNRVWAFPVSVARPYTDAVYMDLDGVMALIGTGIQAEDIIKDHYNQKKYMVFPDVYRSGYDDHFCVLTDGEWTTTTTV